MKPPIEQLQRIAIIASMAWSGNVGSGAFTPTNALTFNFTPTTGTSQQAIDGFAQAGSLFSSLFTDNVTVNININFSNLGGTTLGIANTYTQNFSYTNVYNALNIDRKSIDDRSAVNSLSNSSTFNMLLNRTSNNPNTTNNAATYLDNNRNNNNSSIELGTANAKALGLINSNNTDLDASISFSNQYVWDFDRSNGINTGSFDFIGVATHEIGHALGFFSGVDFLDANPSAADNLLVHVSPLDLFRYSIDSKNAKTIDNKNVIDFTADKRDKYFSVDGGNTKIASFATGINFGDGRQAGHWKDNGRLGIMDPTTDRGELLAITENDIRAFDAIGWDRSAASYSVTAVPEPSNFLGTFIFAAFGVTTIAKRKQKLTKV